MTLTQSYKSAKFGRKTEMYFIFMKFGTLNKSNMLIKNILLGIDDLDPKL